MASCSSSTRLVGSWNTLKPRRLNALMRVVLPVPDVPVIMCRFKAAVLLNEEIMVHLEGESSNLLFETLQEWNEELERLNVNFEEPLL